LEKRRFAIVRGGGDLATGVIYRLWKANFEVLCLEVHSPLVVRRSTAVAEAVFEGKIKIEGMSAERIDTISEWTDRRKVAVLIDPEGISIKELCPSLVVDGIMKKNYTGTSKNMAPLVLALGPGFSAPDQVHGVIETKRGHYLGRLITNGSAIPNTGCPGMEMGYTTERLLRAPASGYITNICNIGDHIEQGETVAAMGDIEIKTKISGTLRGLIHPSVKVEKGLKIGDVDPRDIREYCFTISDKALSVAGGVLEAILSFS